MNFGEAFEEYFTNVCDVTHILSLISYSLMLCFLHWPKKYNVKNIGFLFLRFVCIFASYLIICPLCFSLDRVLKNYNGFLFSFSFLIIPFIYIIIFLKNDIRCTILKLLLIVSSVEVVMHVSQNLGLIAGKLFDDNFALVVTFRTFPVVFCPIIGFLTTKFDINEYQEFPIPIIVTSLVISCSVLGIGIFDSAQNFANDLTVTFLFIMSIIYFILLVLLAISYFSIYYIIKSRHELALKEVQLTLNKADNNLISLDKQNREEMFKIKHDLKNQFSYLKIMLDKDDVKGAKGYLDELINSNIEVFESFSCLNKTISSIINLELNKAKLKGIKIELLVNVPPEIPILDTDLCSLITNMVDNAILYTDLNKPIKVVIKTIQDYFRIIVSNSIVEGSETSAIKLKTKKGYTHGYGTKIIKSIASKYKGYVSFSAKNGQFVTDCVLSLNCKNDKEDVKEDA